MADENTVDDLFGDFGENSDDSFDFGDASGDGLDFDDNIGIEEVDMGTTEDSSNSSSEDDDLFGDFGGAASGDEVPVDNVDTIGDEIGEAFDDISNSVPQDRPGWLGGNIELNEDDLAVKKDKVIVEKTAQQVADENSEVEDDDPFDEVWNQKVDKNGLPIVDSDFANKIKETGEPYVMAFVQGDNMTYVGHGAYSRVEYMMRFFKRALPANVLMFPMGDNDIEKIKNDPLTFKETYKQYVEA